MQTTLTRRGLHIARLCFLKLNDVEFGVPATVLLLLCLDAFCTAYDAAAGEFNSFWTAIGGLFLVPSLLIALMVGMGMMWRQRSWRQRTKSLVKLAALIALVIVHIVSLPYVRSLGVRARVHLVSDEGKLQTWAEEIIKTPLNQLPLRPN